MTRLLLSMSLLVLSAPAFAQQVQSSVSAGTELMSDYSVRGISRSDERPAIQGRLTLRHPAGVFAGAQATSVDLDMDNDASMEGVLAAGYQGNFDGIDFKGQVSYNTYPGADNDDLDYWEFALNGGYDFDAFYGSLLWAVSPDYINSSGLSFYYGSDISVPLNDFTGHDIQATAHLGFQFVDDEGPYIRSDAADWSLGLAYNYAPYDLDFGLQYIDTDLDERECIEECSGRARLSVSKELNW